MLLDVTLYGRADCCLCDKLREALRPLENELGLVVHEADIDSVSDLRARFGLLIPLLVPGKPGTVASPICQTRFNADTIMLLRAWAKHTRAAYQAKQTSIV